MGKKKKPRAKPRAGRRVSKAEKAKLKLSYSARSKKGWATRVANQEAGIFPTRPSRRRVKKTSKVRIVKAASRGDKKLEIHKRIIKLSKSLKVDEFNAAASLDYHLFDRVIEAYDSLKKSKKRLNLFNFSIIFKGKVRREGVIQELPFSIGNAEIKNKQQFRVYFRQVNTRFASELSSYAGRGLSLYVAGAILDGISKTLSNPKKAKKAKTVRGRRS